MTKSLDTFQSVIVRAQKLVAHGRTMEKQDDASDLYRSALVFAVSGFDRYFTHRFADILASHLRQKEPSDELIETLESWGIKTGFLLKLIANQPQRPFRTIRNKVHPALFRLTTQQTKEIDKLFAKIGIKGLTGRINSAHTKKFLIKRVNDAVTRRHSIVHEGDLNRHYKQKTISADRVELYISALCDYVTLADKIVGENSK